MSVEASTWVWNHSAATGTDKLVLLRIADQADKFGGNSWPGIATIARDCGVVPKTVQAVIRRLENAGDLLRLVNAGGSRSTRSDRRPNRYDLPGVPGWLENHGDEWSDLAAERGVVSRVPVSRGVAAGSDGGPFDGPTGGRLRGGDPSINHPDPPPGGDLVAAIQTRIVADWPQFAPANALAPILTERADQLQTTPQAVLGALRVQLDESVVPAFIASPTAFIRRRLEAVVASAEPSRYVPPTYCGNCRGGWLNTDGDTGSEVSRCPCASQGVSTVGDTQAMEGTYDNDRRLPDRRDLN